MSTFRIVSGDQKVGTIIAADRDDALAAFTRGRDLPDGVDLRAYSVKAYETRRPRAAKGYRA